MSSTIPSPLRFVLVGGFLGAGKTTLLAQLARRYAARGLNVGIVTNDQAGELVDTHLLRGQGFAVEEVTGSCFCCNFHGLLDQVERLSVAQRPDVILAEPVGSCTDLVATVLEPLRRMYGTEFSPAPYAVLLKPGHARPILAGEPDRGFSPEAEYILRKQLAEADLVAINRCDVLSSEEIDELERLLQRDYPGTPTLRLSARTGLGLDALMEFLDRRGDFGRKVLEIDYDLYAAGEADLGWLNSRSRIASLRPLPLDDLLRALVQTLQDDLRQRGVEPAHLKVIGQADGCFGVANLVGSDQPTELSVAACCRPTHIDLIVNARVACAPELLQARVTAALHEVCERYGATVEPLHAECFRPSPPRPTYRLAEAVG
jgi:Ni2+-binding GTPase involved in maturation of urease and hydrogenase